MASVTLTSVVKRYGDNVVVSDLDLAVADGEFLVLLGPSGCGKSTVLRMIAGLEEPTSGTVSIGDRDMDGIDARDRDVSMVFQSYALYPHMTVFENIEAPLLGRGATSEDGTTVKVSRSDRRDRVTETAEILGLGDLLKRKPAELSGGQRQRVALARAIVRRPEVFLMDEPLSNLDTKLRTRTRLDLVDLWRRLETTIVYVTHDQIEAMTMATRIAVMADGVLQQVGAPGDVYDDPDNLFVATFIGSPQLNVLPASAIEGAGHRFAGATASIGVRAEHLAIDADLADDAVRMAATVRGYESLGHETHVICTAGGVDVVVRQGPEVAVPALGAEVTVSCPPGRVLAFDDDGKRIRS